ncbi:MAG TPA: hypothetical protein VMW94_01375 [Actinomycetes bacterium]|nr:hypothetical protein [Actinomycetes bacterium]
MSDNRTGDEAVASYLSRLERAGAGLPPDRRSELLQQIREHLDEVSSSPGATEAGVLTAIDRLGDPAVIVAAEELPTAGPATVSPTPPSRWGPLEVISVALLTVGSFLLPVVGPTAGLVCAWLSRQWTHREKAVATLLVAPTFLLFGLLLAWPLLRL